MSSQHSFSGLDSCLSGLSGAALDDATRVLYGRKLQSLDLPPSVASLADEGDFDVEAYECGADREQLRAPRKVRIAALQYRVALPTDAPIEEQRQAIYSRVAGMLSAAAAAGVNIACMHEYWTMPYFPCTRERLPWTEFAEHAETGPSTAFLSQLAERYNMVIISSIIERDEADILWNTAVIISNTGRVLGKTRKNHIPRMGDFNESHYFMESNLGHPVFETEWGRIAVNICYGRRIPLNWMAYALNGAEVIFNPNGTTEAFESLWHCEGRTAAVANQCWTVNINRVGLETFPREFTSGDARPAHKTLERFFGSSYIANPDGSRTRSLSRTRDGVLIQQIDLNLARQMRDKWPFRMTWRLPLYAETLSAAAQPDYRPNIIREEAAQDCRSIV